MSARISRKGRARIVDACALVARLAQRASGNRDPLAIVVNRMLNDASYRGELITLASRNLEQTLESFAGQTSPELDTARDRIRFLSGYEGRVL